MRTSCLKFATIFVLLLYALPVVSHQWKESSAYTYVDIQDYSITYWQKIINVDNTADFQKMKKLPSEVKEFLKNKKIAYLILDIKLECPTGKATLSQVFYVDKNNNDLLQVVFGESPFYKVFTTPNGSGIKFEMKDPLLNPQAQFNTNDSNRTYCQFVMDKLRDKE